MKVLATTTYRNGAFHAARLRAGLSQMELADLAGVSAIKISGYETFKKIPRDLAVIKNLEDALGEPYDVLFPPEFKRAVELKMGRKITKTYDVTMRMLEAAAAGDMLALPDGDATVDLKELKRDISGALTKLTPRETVVVRCRFGLDGEVPHELEEVGAKLGISRERVRQIELKALSKLRHPSRSQILESYTRFYTWEGAKK